MLGPSVERSADILIVDAGGDQVASSAAERQAVSAWFRMVVVTLGIVEPSRASARPRSSAPRLASIVPRAAPGLNGESAG
jgi:hypothetical protein